MPQEPPVLTRRPDDAGDQAGRHIRMMVEQYADALYRTAIRLTRQREEAQDLVQETFTRAWRARATFRPDGPGRAWLFAIMMNARAEALRRAGKGPPVEHVDAGDELYLYDRVQAARRSGETEDPAEAVFNALLSDEVETALRHVPEEFLAVFALADLEHFRYHEICQILGVPIGTVRSRLSRARHLLQEALWEYCVRTGVCRMPATAVALGPWPPDCAEACRHLCAFLERDLDAATLGQVEAHLATCRHCCDRAAFQQRLLLTLRAERPGPRVPTVLRRRLEQLVARF